MPSGDEVARHLAIVFFIVSMAILMTGAVVGGAAVLLLFR